MVNVLVDGLINSIWELADKDSRASADLLEHAIARLQEEETGDRQTAQRKTRKEQDATR